MNIIKFIQKCQRLAQKWKILKGFLKGDIGVINVIGKKIK